jgi:hypothetical protein
MAFQNESGSPATLEEVKSQAVTTRNASKSPLKHEISQKKAHLRLLPKEAQKFRRWRYF